MSANAIIASYVICGCEPSGRKTTLSSNTQVISLSDVPTNGE
jgi:hypothetical protein